MMVDQGLQPTALFLAIFPSILCVVIVSVRVWMRWRKKLLGIGKFDVAIQEPITELTGSLAEDVLLVIATVNLRWHQPDFS